LWYAIRFMDIASNLFIAAFLVLVAASAAVVGSMIAAKVFDLAGHGVALVGDVPTGFSFMSSLLTSMIVG